MSGLWLAQAPVSETDRTSVSPVLLDRDANWLTVRTVEDGAWRLPVELDDIDPDFIEALLSIEDRRYFTHAGVDVPAIFRAARSWAGQGEIVSGASTLTMQLVRQYKPRPRTLRSKLIESLEALRFELHYNKTEILTQYLTRISYGGNVQGIQSASHIYFGKSAEYLTPAEIALLIALPQAPEARRPDRYADGARRGRDQILKRLLANGVISQDNFDDAVKAPIPLRRNELPSSAYLTSWKLNGASTLDGTLQTYVEAQLARTLEGLPEPVNASAMIIHAPSQEVRAHAATGLRSHAGGWIDMTAATRSPGSTLKPFVFGVGLDDGLLQMDSRVRDAPARYGRYQPENFDRRYHGDVRVSEALQHSLNTPAVAVLDQVGGYRFESLLLHAGLDVQGTGQGAVDDNLALALGGVGLRAIDLATLYTALANDGELAPLRWTLDAPEPERISILKAESARDIRKALMDAPLPKGFSGLSHKVAYKTGTSYGFRDSWAAGIYGDYVLIVWIGRPDGAPRPGVTGRNGAAPILFDMLGALPEVRQLQTHGGSHQTHTSRMVTPTDIAPQIVFPADGSEIRVRDFGKDARGIRLAAASKSSEVSYYVDGQAVPKTGQMSIWRPSSPGFYTIEVFDAQGRSGRASIRVLAQDQIINAGL